MQTLKIQEFDLNFKKITPFDLMQSDYLIPFQIFMVIQKTEGIWGRVEAINNSHQEKTIDKEKIKPIIYSLLKLSIINFDEKVFAVTYTEEDLHKIVNIIITNSLKYFNGIYNINKDTVLYIDQTAKRYGILPMDLICKDKSLYNDLDAFLFNCFIQNIAVFEENLAAQRQRQKAKSKRRF